MQRDDERDSETHPPSPATLVDPSGPRWLRFLPHMLGAALFLGALASSAFAPDAATIAAALGAFAIAAARFMPLGRPRRSAQLRFLPGEVEVRDAGLRNTRLRARHVEGATTARTKEGYRLTLRHAARPRPVTIEVRSLDELERLCRSLGVGTRGYGSLAFVCRPSASNTLESVARAGVSLSALGLVIATATGSEELAAMLLALLGIGAAFAMMAMVDRATSGPPTVRLDAHSVQLPASRSYPWVSYQAIESMEIVERGFVARLRQDDRSLAPQPLLIDAYRQPGVPEGMTHEEKELFREIVLTAAARGRGQMLPVTSVTDAVERLSRRSGETAAAWLARVDALATTPQAAYRGNALSRDELTRALEDTDLEADVRAAAARILARDPKDRKLRVAPVVAAEHDERARVRIAAATEGRDEELLALLDEDEHGETGRRAKKVG